MEWSKPFFALEMCYLVDIGGSNHDDYIREYPISPISLAYKLDLMESYKFMTS